MHDLVLFIFEEAGLTRKNGVRGRVSENERLYWASTPICDKTRADYSLVAEI